MKNLTTLFYIGLFFFVSSCDEPVFIFDPSKPALPIYSDKGYNVAGAEIDGKYWISTLGGGNYFQRPETIKIIRDVAKGRLVIIVPGVFTNSNSNYVEKKHLAFIINTDNIKSFTDITKLDNTTIQLNDSSTFGIITDPFHYESRYTILDVQSSSGKLNIFKARFDVETSTIILSGTFGFDYTDSYGEDNSVYFGRFDFKIHEDMFVTL